MSKLLSNLAKLRWFYNLKKADTPKHRRVFVILIKNSPVISIPPSQKSIAHTASPASVLC